MGIPHGARKKELERSRLTHAGLRGIFGLLQFDRFYQARVQSREIHASNLSTPLVTLQLGRPAPVRQACVNTACVQIA